MTDNRPLYGLTGETLLEHLGPSWGEMTPGQRKSYGPQVQPRGCEELNSVHVRAAILARSMWNLDVSAIGTRLRATAPHLRPLFMRLARVPLHWADAPRDEEEFIQMLAELDA